MKNKFSPNCVKVFQLAKDSAENLHSKEITTIHLLMSMLNYPTKSVADSLNEQHINMYDLRDTLEKHSELLVSNNESGIIPFSQELKNVLNIADKNRETNLMEPMHLLWSIIEDKTCYANVFLKGN